MGLKSTIYTILQADASVFGLVGNRVYPAKSPQDPVMPCVVYQTISCVRDSTQDGLSGYVTTRVQFDCLSRTAVQADELAKKVVQALCEPHPSPASGNVQIFSAFADDQRDEWSDELEVHVTSVDIMFEHAEE